MLQVLDAAAVRRWCSTGVEALRAAREEVDALNVYPVPDGDTGTNLLLTMQSVDDAVRAAGADMAATVRAVASGGLLGARGNSGVILSQLLRGLCEGLPPGGGGPHDLTAGFARAAELAYAAVAVPAEGTLLTVARRAAEGAVGGDLATVVRGARAAAAEALARTPEQLPALAAAGVVDAGGRGLCVLLEALEQVVTGAVRPGLPAPLVRREGTALAAAREAGSPAFAFEVQLLLRDSSAAAVAELEARLSRLGDSLVVVGHEDLWNVHVHVNDVDGALTAARAAGTPFRVTVTRFRDASAPSAPPGPAPSPVPSPGAGARAVVAVAAGEGLARLLASCGAVVVDAGPTGPSTPELLDAVRRTGAAEVVLLPNGSDVLAVACAAASAAAEQGQRVEVVPTLAVVQGLAALAVADADLPLADAVVVMRDAADTTRWAEVTTAVRATPTAAGPGGSGDALGLLLGAVVEVGADVEGVALRLLDRLLAPGAELVTVLVGAGAPQGAGDRLAERARAAGAEVTVYEGGQPRSLLLIGAE